MQSTLKRPTDPVQLRAILDLQKRGWSSAEIMHHLDISRATYYRRLAEIRRRAEAAAGRDEDA